MSRTAAWIGLRYLRARSENRFVGFISVIAMAGIALGVMVLIAVLSVMNGFERDLSRRILDIVAHATIEGDGGRLDDWRGILEKTRGATGVFDGFATGLHIFFSAFDRGIPCVPAPVH